MTGKKCQVAYYIFSVLSVTLLLLKQIIWLKTLTVIPNKIVIQAYLAETFSCIFYNKSTRPLTRNYFTHCSTSFLNVLRIYLFTYSVAEITYHQASWPETEVYCSVTRGRPCLTWFKSKRRNFCEKWVCACVSVCARFCSNARQLLVPMKPQRPIGATCSMKASTVSLTPSTCAVPSAHYKAVIRGLFVHI